MHDVIGHGVDLVEVARIARSVAEHGQRFLARVFTEGERGYAEANTRRVNEHLAVRFAAKEAVLKALGTGWSQGIGWRDVEIVREPSGRPAVRLTGVAAEVAERMGVERWHVSLSHTDTMAMASVIACGPGGG